jgi:rSAM/selenodomain-associated transferase 2
MCRMLLSIIIPTLNEAQSLPQTLGHLRSAAGDQPIEVIVSDCHSADGTGRIATECGAAAVVRGAICRSDALNRGARAARGDVLLFLHADSLPPNQFPRIIARSLDNPSVVGGAFDFKFAPDPLAHGLHKQALRFVVLLNRARFRITRNFYGDQAIFVRRDTFDRIGGFPPVRLMEDVRFSRKMKRLGRTAILRPPVTTSPRRFLARGVLRQLFADIVLLVHDEMGLNPERRWEHYNRLNHTPPAAPTPDPPAAIGPLQRPVASHEAVAHGAADL